MALEQCLSCEQSGGIVRDPEDHLEYASCRHPAAVAGARRESAGAAAGRTPVSAVMTSDLLAVRPDVSLEAVTTLLLERGIGGAPVVDEIGRPIGVCSKTDLLGRRPGTGGSVAEAMTREAVTVSETASLSEAAALMSARGIHRVLVLSDDGKLSGILTSEDIVRWFARGAGADLRPAP